MALPVFKSFFWVSIERFAVLCIQFVGTVVLARLIGPDEFGMIGILTVFIAIAMDLSQSTYFCLFPYLVVTQTVPVMVLGPLFTMWFGFGLTPKILMVVLDDGLHQNMLKLKWQAELLERYLLDYIA